MNMKHNDVYEGMLALEDLGIQPCSRPKSTTVNRFNQHSDRISLHEAYTISEGDEQFASISSQNGRRPPGWQNTIAYPVDMRMAIVDRACTKICLHAVVQELPCTMSHSSSPGAHIDVSIGKPNYRVTPPGPFLARERGKRS